MWRRVLVSSVLLVDVQPGSSFGVPLSPTLKPIVCHMYLANGAMMQSSIICGAGARRARAVGLVYLAGV